MARCAILLESEEVFDIAEDLHRKHVDVEVEVAFRCGLYVDTQSWVTKRFRVGVRNKDDDDYHFYITNLPREWLFPVDRATIYRCRWAVELLFRELKTLYGLDEFDMTNPAVVEVLLYAAVLTLFMSCELLELLIEHADDDAVFPPERWAATSSYQRNLWMFGRNVSIQSTAKLTRRLNRKKIPVRNCLKWSSSSQISDEISRLRFFHSGSIAFSAPSSVASDITAILTPFPATFSGTKTIVPEIDIGLQRK